MRLLIGLALIALACALLAAGVGAQERSLALEERSASGLTVTWSWSGRAASAFEVAWRAGGDDDQTAWRTARKDAAERRHTITELDAGVRYIVRVRGLDGAGRPIDDLRGIFATSWSAPRLLRVIASDDGALTLSWAQPSDWTPRGWRLSWRAAGSQTAGGTIDLPAAARSRRIDGLSTGTDYRIRLTALNSRGGESPAQTLRATAAEAGPATPRLTALTWSGLTIRAEWETVPRASGYDLFWRAADERGGAVGRLSVAGTSAEFAVPAAGVYRVEVRARSGAGRSAAHGDRSPPRSIALRPAPAELRVQRFDGEYVHLTWRAVGAERYAVEWGERGGAVRTALRAGGDAAGAEPTLSLGPLQGGKTYEFRVRARNDQGGSAPSPPATLTPTRWPETPPPGLWLFVTFNHQTGGIDVTPPAVVGAPWYEAQWVNYADDAERGRARSSGAERRVRLSRAGGFENGLWYIRVRAGPWGTWSTRAHYHRVISQPPRLALALESSRELCTAGTLTEISWQISGGSAPYALSIEDSAVDVSADNIRINCGALTETEAADAEAGLAARRITAVVTDSRGVRREAALDVARARALLAPQPTPFVTYADAIVTDWHDDDSKLDGTTSLFLIRWRSTPATKWSYKTLEHTHRPFNVVHVYLDGLSQGVSYQFQFAALRDRLEAETPDVLQWALRSATTLAPPTGLSAVATHDTVTVTWDTQPAAGFFYVWLDGPANSAPPVHDSRIYTPTDHDHGQPLVAFNHVPPDREYTVRVRVGSSSLSETSGPLEATTSVRTRSAPPAWTAPLRGAQRVRAAATENSITVTWDAPYPEASGDNYHLMLFHPTRSGIRHERVYDGSTTFTFDNLEPGLTYRVVIDHIAIVESRSETEVTTLPEPATGAAGQVLGGAEVPIPDWPRPKPKFSWPFAFIGYSASQRAYMTADVWSMRSYGAHAGLDLAGLLGEEDKIQASLAGTLRAYQLERVGHIVVYCPDVTLPFEEQFHLSTEEWAWKPPGATATRRTGCGRVASPKSGNVALIFHGEIGGKYYMTKYGHLASFTTDIETQLANSSHGYATKEVARGEVIGTEGSTGESSGDHLHFEIRTFNGSAGEVSSQWYTESGGFVRGCTWYDGEENKEYCAWDTTLNDDPRIVVTVLDPERELPPSPASHVQTHATGHGPASEERARLVAMERSRLEPLIDGEMFVVELSVGLFRPLFYHNIADDSDWDGAANSQGRERIRIPGLLGLRPGVVEYDVSVSCDAKASMRVEDPPEVYSPPTRLQLVARLAANSSCDLTVYTGNDTHGPGVPVPTGLYGRDGVEAIRPAVPRVRVERLGRLSYGTGQVTGTLIGAHYQFYEFDAVPREEHVFTPTIGNAGDVSDLVLEIWGPSGLVKYPNNEPVSTKNFANSARPLLWTPPRTVAGPHFLLVRAGHSTSVPAPEGTYRLRAKLPFAQCSLSGAASGSGDDGPVGASEDAAGAVDDGGGGSTTPCRPQAPTGLTVGTRTPVRLTLNWTAGVGASFHEVKATTRANCNEKSETYETPSSNSATSHPLTDLTPNTPYRLCVRSVRTIGSDSFRSAWAETPETMTTAKLAAPSTRAISDSDITTNTITLRWSKVPDADGYEVKRTTDSGETEIESLPETARWHEFDDLLPSKPYTFYVRATLDAHSSVTSAWASRSATTSAASAPQPVDDPPSISLSVVVKPKRCYPDATVSVDWKVSDATGTPTVTVNDDLVTTTPTSITCESDIRSQPISVSARDSTGSSSSYSTSVTVLEPPVMPDVCLSNMGVGTAAYQTKTSCGAVTASDLLSAIRGDNSGSNVCVIWHWRDGGWLRYGVTLDGQVAPGSTNYTINPGDLLTLGRCTSTSDGAGGASGNEPPSCPDALKPASGPVVIDVASTDCATVRGGGAAQISRGDYTLNVTLPSDRDWWALAPTSYHDNPGGAFIFLDLTTGGWLALNPADAAELARHAPADADGLPALLDAIAASASAPAAE